MRGPNLPAQTLVKDAKRLEFVRSIEFLTGFQQVAGFPRFLPDRRIVTQLSPFLQGARIPGT